MWLCRLAIIGAVCSCGDDGPVTPQDGGPDASPIPSVIIDPAAFDFGDVAVGTTSADVMFFVRNDGIVATTIDAVTVAGADFSVASSTCGELPAAAQCEVIARFAPTVPEPRSAVLEVAATSGTASSRLVGRGTSTGELVITPSGKNLGDIPVGQTSAPFVFQVLNQTSAPTTIATSLTGAPGFAIASSTCDGELAIYARCELAVTFTPPYGGEFVGNLRITGGDTAAAGLVATSTTPLSIGPYDAFYDPMLLGQAQPGERITFTIWNTTMEPSGTLAASLVGDDAEDFAIRSTTCTTLPKESMCTVDVQLAPTSRGPKLVELDVRDTAANISVRASLHANVYSVLVIGDTTIADTAVGQTRTLTLSVANPSETSAGTPSLSLIGADATEYAIASTTCNAPLAAHTTCAVELAFTPTSTGMKQVTLQVDASPGSSDTHAVSGRGI